MPRTALKTHRWSRAEYECMISLGIFQPESHLELIDGKIIDMAPQGSLHAVAVQLVTDALRQIISHAYSIRIQMPLAVDNHSEPEPDIAVVIGKPRDYRSQHPKTAGLIVEISDTTLSYDRRIKKRLYARNGIKEYWILNLIDSQLEIYQDPQGQDYNSMIALHAGETVSPLIFTSSKVLVADLLP